LWTSMPTYLILFIGRLLAVGNLGFRNFRLLLAGRPFILRGEFLGESFSNPNKRARKGGSKTLQNSSQSKNNRRMSTMNSFPGSRLCSADFTPRFSSWEEFTKLSNLALSLCHWPTSTSSSRYLIVTLSLYPIWRPSILVDIGGLWTTISYSAVKGSSLDQPRVSPLGSKPSNILVSLPGK
jgi:hypothetical protein